MDATGDCKGTKGVDKYDMMRGATDPKPPQSKKALDAIYGLAFRHRLSQGVPLGVATATALWDAVSIAPPGFNSKRGTGTARTFFVSGPHLESKVAYIKYSEPDLEAENLCGGKGNFKKQGYVRRVDTETGELSRCVLLTADDETNTEGRALTFGNGNIKDIIKEEKKAQKLQSEYVMGPAESCFVYEKHNMVSGERTRRIALIKQEAFGDASMLLPESLMNAREQGLVRHYGPLAPVDRVRIVLHAAKGLRHIEQMGFVHRDIKPDNILVFRNQYGRIAGAKIADLGHLIRPSKIRTIICTNTEYYPSDVVVTGDRHFEAADDRYALGKVMQKVSLGAVSINVIREWNGLAADLTISDPALRPSAESLVERLSTILKVVKEEEKARTANPIRGEPESIHTARVTPPAAGGSSYMEVTAIKKEMGRD